MLRAYFERVGLTADPSAVPSSAETLNTICAAHALKVPWGNADLFVGKLSPCDPDHAWNKIVTEGRGGWCFEHVFCLERVLTQIGFGIKRAAGAVAIPLPNGETVYTGSTAHALLLVTTSDGKKFIVDSGFSDAPLQPLSLDVGDSVQSMANGRSFKLVWTDDGMIARMDSLPLNPGEWRLAWRFDPKNLRGDLESYKEGLQWVQTNETSPFLKGLILSKLLEGGGRLTLSGTDVITTDKKWKKSRRQAGLEEIGRLLHSEFGESASLFQESQQHDPPIVLETHL